MKMALLTGILALGLAGWVQVIAQAPRPAGGVAPRPPASTAGHSTLRDRQVNAGVREVLRDRLGSSDGSNSRRPPAPAPPPDPAPGALPGPLGDGGEFHRSLRADSDEVAAFESVLADRRRRMRTRTYHAELALAAGSSPPSIHRFVYQEALSERGVLFRIEPRGLKEGESAPTAYILQRNEEGVFTGHLRDARGIWREIRGDPRSIALMPGHPVQLGDLMPLDVHAVAWTRFEEGFRDGKPVMRASPALVLPGFGGGRFDFERYSAVPRNAQGSRGADRVLLVEADAASIDGLRLPLRRHLRFEPSGAFCLIRLSEATLNTPVEAAVFQVPGL